MITVKNEKKVEEISLMYWNTGIQTHDCEEDEIQIKIAFLCEFMLLL